MIIFLVYIPRSKIAVSKDNYNVKILNTCYQKVCDNGLLINRISNCHFIQVRNQFLSF